MESSELFWSEFLRLSPFYRAGSEGHKRSRLIPYAVAGICGMREGRLDR